MHTRQGLQRVGVSSRWGGTRALGATAALIALTAIGCGGARPYRLMAKAATSEENVRGQMDDHRLKASMREALLTHDLLHVTPYAYMGHAYLVGFVDSATQRQNAIAAVQGLAGMRSLDTYLPDTPAGGSSMASDVETKAAVKAALALDPSEVVTRIDLDVLDGHVVLLGVVDSQQAIESAVAHAQGASGVTGVTNFLVLPEGEYEKRRPSLR